MPRKDKRATPSVAPALTLRQRAEASLRELPEDFDVLSPAALRQMFHDLRVHQAELEMQNEDLRAAQLALATAQARYFDFYDLAPVGYLSVNARGLIEQANLTTAALLGVARETLLTQPISHFILKADQDIYYQLRRQLLETNQRQSCELHLLTTGGTPFWVRLEAIAVRDEAGTTALRIVLSDITEHKRAEDQLREMAAELEHRVNERTLQLRQMAVQLALTEERERRLLAEDLHDNLGQLLAVIKIKLSALVAGSPQASIDEIVKLVDQSDQAVRMITQQLSPPILKMLDFMSTLQWLAEEMRRQYGLLVDIDGNNCLTPLVNEIQAMLFRSVRELLINVARHAKVDAATLTVRRDGEQLRLVVSDAGCGFTPTCFGDALPGHGSFGLASIHERMSTIGGKMEIDSRPGHGTTITLTLPCTIATKEAPPS